MQGEVSRYRFGEGCRGEDIRSRFGEGCWENGTMKTQKLIKETMELTKIVHL